MKRDYYRALSVLTAAEMEMIEAGMMIVEGRVDIAQVMIERAKVAIQQVREVLCGR